MCQVSLCINFIVSIIFIIPIFYSLNKYCLCSHKRLSPLSLGDQKPPRDSLRYSATCPGNSVHASLLTNISPPAGISDFRETKARTGKSSENS